MPTVSKMAICDFSLQKYVISSNENCECVFVDKQSNMQKMCKSDWLSDEWIDWLIDWSALRMLPNKQRQKLKMSQWSF